MSRLSPAQAHILRVTAAAVALNDEENISGYEKMLMILARHRKEMKGMQSMQKRAEYKKSILPDYLPWIEGALSQETGKQDDVLMMWQIWSIDCGEFELALTIAKHAVFNDLVLPEQFSRTLGTALAEEFADRAKFARESQADFPFGYLLDVKNLVADLDMPDESRARLFKEVGYSLLTAEPKTALEYFNQALGLDNRCGLKGEVKKLKKQLHIALTDEEESESDEEENKSDKDSPNTPKT